MTLDSSQGKAFLSVVSATCWSVWRLRNNICFNEYSMQSIRSMILTICTFVSHCAGNMKAEIQTHLQKWMSIDVDMIPLQSLSPMKRLSGIEEKGLVPLVPLLAMA